MRVGALLHRLPWLASLLVGCEDASAGGGESSTADATSTTTESGTANSTGTTGGESTTGAADTTGDESTTGAADTTGGSATGDTGTTRSNAAPTAVDDVVFTRQNVGLVLDASNGLLENDTDVDGDPLTVTGFDAVSVGGEENQSGSRVWRFQRLRLRSVRSAHEHLRGGRDTCTSRTYVPGPGGQVLGGSRVGKPMRMDEPQLAFSRFGLLLPA